MERQALRTTVGCIIGTDSILKILEREMCLRSLDLPETSSDLKVIVPNLIQCVKEFVPTGQTITEAFC